jgi:hypothetical protein
MGSFRIIESKTRPSVCISRHIAHPRSAQRSVVCAISIVLVAFGASIAPTHALGATTAPRGVRTGKMAQYHRLEGRQYHEMSWSTGAASAWLGESLEFRNAIPMAVISRLFTLHSPNSISKVMIQHSSRPGDRISSRTDRSIEEQIGRGNGRDPRLMLQIGAVLGLVYLAFLAVWFWATRFRMRPPSSAPS